MLKSIIGILSGNAALRKTLRILMSTKTRVHVFDAVSTLALKIFSVHLRVLTSLIFFANR